MEPGTQFNDGGDSVLFRRRRRVVVDENSFKHFKNFLLRRLQTQQKRSVWHGHYETSINTAEMLCVAVTLSH